MQHTSVSDYIAARTRTPWSLGVRMLLALVTLGLLSVCAAAPGASKDGTADRIHYEQQQHATSGGNIRVNLNKILIAILPLEEAISSVGAFGGGSDDFDLTISDLRPPEPPETEYPDEEDGATSEDGSTTPSTEDGSTTPSTVEASTPLTNKLLTRRNSQKPVRNQVAGLRRSCTQAEIAAGRCNAAQQPHRANGAGLARLLIPLLQRLQQD